MGSRLQPKPKAMLHPVQDGSNPLLIECLARARCHTPTHRGDAIGLSALPVGSCCSEPHGKEVPVVCKTGASNADVDTGIWSQAVPIGGGIRRYMCVWHLVSCGALSTLLWRPRRYVRR